MNQIEAFQLLLRIFQTIPDLRLRQPLDLLQPSHRFRQDLGFDSLAMISLLVELQDYIPQLEESEVAQWKTIGDCLDYLTGRVLQKDLN